MKNVTKYSFLIGALSVLLLQISFADGPVIGTYHYFTAAQSCRTELANHDINRHDASKLSVRSDATAAKSWIKFDLSSLIGVDPNTLRAATLTVALAEGEGGNQACDLSAVNDNCLDNADWTEASLTWDNAPGNDTASQTSLNATKTTFVSTFDVVNGLAGQQYVIDVLPIIRANTDGNVQFVLYNSSVLINFSTHDHPNAANRPVLMVVQAPAGADAPTPYPGQVVPTSLGVLDWVNPEPNSVGGSIICDVYLARDLGTEPNKPDMDKVTLATNVSSVAINTTNFPTVAPLIDNESYYWIVDCYDTSTSTMVPGLVWNFSVDNNIAPFVSAGADQVTWGLPKVINLDGTTSDDGLPNPPASYTVEWTQVANTAPTITISPNNADHTSVTITQRGDYEFMLTADDGRAQASDTVRIVVGDDACDASHQSTGNDYYSGDFNQDCIVNLDDFAVVASNWLDCSDTQTNCL